MCADTYGDCTLLYEFRGPTGDCWCVYSCPGGGELWIAC
jgi:hypothetical protein